MKCSGDMMAFRVDENLSETEVVNNTQRRREFQTRTVITEESGEKMVYKCAAGLESRPFIKLIVEREERNIDYLEGQFEVLRGCLQGDRIKYAYLGGRSLKDMIIEHMKEGHHDAACELLKEYVKRINSLGRINAVPEVFLCDIVNDSANEFAAIDCLERGVLDLICKNILISGGHWIVIDNEWSFDFPVPVRFLLFRAIREIIFTEQVAIRRAANKAHPVTGLFAGRWYKFYVPIEWLEYLIEGEIGLERLIRWEVGFQRYVNGPSYASHLRAVKKPRIRRQFFLM